MRYPPDGSEASVGDGDWVTVQQSMVVENAPTFVTLSSEGVDDDTWDVGFGVSLAAIVISNPQYAPGEGYGEDDYKVWARGQQDFALNWGPSGIATTQPFNLQSPAGGGWFAVFGHF